MISRSKYIHSSHIQTDPNHLCRAEKFADKYHFPHESLKFLTFLLFRSKSTFKSRILSPYGENGFFPSNSQLKTDSFCGVTIDFVVY